MKRIVTVHGIDGARGLARFERRENKRFKRGGFGATKEFAALDLEWGLVERLAAYIPRQLKKPTQLNLLLRDLDVVQKPTGKKGGGRGFCRWASLPAKIGSLPVLRGIEGA